MTSGNGPLTAARWVRESPFPMKRSLILKKPLTAEMTSNYGSNDP